MIAAPTDAAPSRIVVDSAGGRSELTSVNPTQPVRGRHRTVDRPRPVPWYGSAVRRGSIGLMPDVSTVRCAEPAPSGRWDRRRSAAPDEEEPRCSPDSVDSPSAGAVWCSSLTVLFMIVSAVVGTGAFGVLKAAASRTPTPRARAPHAVLDARFDDRRSQRHHRRHGDRRRRRRRRGRRGRPSRRRRRARRRARRRRLVVLGARLATAAAQRQRRRALVLAVVDGDDEDVEEALERHPRPGRRRRPAPRPSASVAAKLSTSTSPRPSRATSARAEMIAVPITLLLLLVVFGGLIAASLPLFVGVIAVLGTFLSLFVIGSLTDVSIYSINLTTALGLGLAIDYSLFVVSRYREELRAGRSVDDAVVRTVETAGRTVAFSALTVAVSLVGPARLPAVLPALVRLRRHRRRDAGDGRLDRRPAGAAGCRRHPHRRPARPAPSRRRSAEEDGLLAPHGAAGHAPPDARRRRRRRRAAPPRRAVPAA